MTRDEALALHRQAPFTLSGVLATYTPVDGADAFSITVIPRYNAERVTAQGFLERRDVVHVRRADLPREPRQGDRLSFGGVTHEVDASEDADQQSRRVLLVRRILAP